MEAKRTEISVANAAEYIKSGESYTVYCHASPDGDTVGSAVALVTAMRYLGIEASVFVCDEVPQKLRFIDVNGCVSSRQAGRRISVDIASRPMLGSYKEMLDFAFDLSVDHHEHNTIECDRLLLRTSYASCGELIYELITALGIVPDAAIATALYAAISSDSGCFKYSSTRPETHLIASELLKTGIDFALINRRIFEQKTAVQMELERIAYNSVKLYLGGRLAVVEISDADLERLRPAESDMDNLHQIPRQIGGVEVSALVRRKGDEIKISLRSNDYFNVADFASATFGGGGHCHAAGCRVPAGTNNVGELLAEKLKGKLA